MLLDPRTALWIFESKEERRGDWGPEALKCGFYGSTPMWAEIFADMIYLEGLNIPNM